MTMPPIVADDMDAADVARVLLARQRALSTPADIDDHPVEALLAFDLAGVAHGLPIDRIRAVAPLPKITRVPHAPAALTGLVAWRGMVVNLFTPAAALGRDAGTPAAMLVLRHDAPRIALAVDALLGVVDVAINDAAPALARLVGSDDDRLTRVDPDLLIDALLPSRPQEG